MNEQRSLGRGLSSLINEQALRAATANEYRRETKAVTLLGPLPDWMAPVTPSLCDDPMTLDDEVCKASAFLCAYRRKLKQTDPIYQQTLHRELQYAIEGEKEIRRALLGHMDALEYQA